MFAGCVVDGYLSTVETQGNNKLDNLTSPSDKSKGNDNLDIKTKPRDESRVTIPNVFLTPNS
ncbi:MAG: hypothetical protein ABSG15_08925 [FCB group bacterium]|jgi:hypothetical protein